MTPGKRTYDAALREAERLRGDLVEEHPGRASPEELSRWADDPVAWDLEAGREPVDYQRDVMRSVATNKRTAWRGCHACGKDWAIGSLAVWGAYARGMLVLVVSATERQVIGQTMREVRRAWRAVRRAHGVGGELYQGSVRVGGEDRIVALTGSASVDALTGWHDPDSGVMVLISEGQGERLEEAAYDAAEGNVTTSKGRILAAGNPIRPEGRFHRIHRRGTWQRFRTAAADTPNVRAGEVVRPGFPAPGWPQDVKREYGEDSAFYRGRVEAEFPSSSEDALVEGPWVASALERWSDGALEAEARGTPIDVGVDPARLGPDRTAACVRQGPVVRGFETWRGADTMETTGRIVQLVRRLQADTAGVRYVVVDEVGLGAGVLDRLRETLPDLGRFTDADGREVTNRRPRARGFSAGERAGRPDRFADLRAQAYWRIRKLLEGGDLALPPEDGLPEELMQTRVRFASDGRTRIESKEDLKSRLGRSPDLADALAVSLGPDLERDGDRDSTRLGAASA